MYSTIHGPVKFTGENALLHRSGHIWRLKNTGERKKIKNEEYDFIFFNLEKNKYTC